MTRLTYLPLFVRAVFCGMSGVWKSQAATRLFWWRLIFMQAGA